MLLFIKCRSILYAIQYLISIHLMLLFILRALYWSLEVRWFQYISCYCLSSTLEQTLSKSSNFNTSHVTVYRQISRPLTKYSSNFNTSHVTVYRRWITNIGRTTNISIHLMLLFIKGHSTGYALVSYFNTSHVTVYRVVGLFESKKRLFQYISCYCLSY